MAFAQHAQNDSDGPYTFSSRPRPAENHSKYREPPSPQSHQNSNVIYTNIMYDRRVVRGNTYAQQTVQADVAEIQRQQESRKRTVTRKRASELLRVRTPEALHGRKHIDVQTELYLEELSDVLETNNTECQTDAFLDRPSTPLFIPTKSGKDVGTQIEEGELFDFDREVQPLLEVLVGKTMEQALLEVMEEEELACLRAQQRAFQELRKAELAEVQRLEEQERRRNEEKEGRFAQQREALQKEKEVVEKLAACAYTQQYVADLLPAVFSSLRSQGYLYDPLEKDIETNFVPWLMGDVNFNLEKRHVARQLLDMIIYDATQNQLRRIS
ncbi:radial spoke head protein 3 homolog isoform X2 [Genypterus blacodes]|uniref:radial spoke head protein 3 homolog isoform X2 n=1 Tax=Genypterus blacodes TaxID=154954 RepID=UPI003F764C2F